MNYSPNRENIIVIIFFIFLMICLSLSSWGIRKAHHIYMKSQEKTNKFSDFKGVVIDYFVTGSYDLNLIIQNENFENCTYYNYYSSDNINLIVSVANGQLGNLEKYSQKKSTKTCSDLREFNQNGRLLLFISIFCTIISSLLLLVLIFLIKDEK